MDRENANIYTREQAEALGIDFDELIPMEEEKAKAEMKRRLDRELQDHEWVDATVLGGQVCTVCGVMRGIKEEDSEHQL